MPYQGHPDGLYLLRQPSKKGIYHYGVLDIGNRMLINGADGINPIVAHQTPPSVRFDWFQNTGTWELMGKVFDENSALIRLRKAMDSPRYDLFGNNCEHFARFVVTGQRQSTQIQAALFTAGLVTLAVMAIKSD